MRRGGAGAAGGDQPDALADFGGGFDMRAARSSATRSRCDMECLLEFLQRAVQAGRAVGGGDAEDARGGPCVEIEQDAERDDLALTGASGVRGPIRGRGRAPRRSGSRSSRGGAASSSRRSRRRSERKWSSATVRATWQSQVRAEPRSGSKRCQSRSARSNVTAGEVLGGEAVGGEPRRGSRTRRRGAPPRPA